VAGLTIGLVTSLVKTPLKKRQEKSAHKENVVLVVSCETNQKEWIQDILWGNAALGLSVVYEC
jgi:hypothetical protein